MRVLLVLGHMRSGSSLLMHILNTHPRIVGYGETHLDYREPEDFVRLLYRVYRSFGRLRATEEYVADKVLHTRHLEDAEVLRHEGLRAVFVLRKPEETLPSLMRMRFEFTEDQALAYYSKRLETLADHASSLDAGRAFFLTYEELLHRSAEVLNGLRNFLELQEPLKEEYELHWASGLEGKGDSSRRIETGRIVRRPPRRGRPAVSPRVLSAARRRFADCVEELGVRTGRTGAGEGGTGRPRSARARPDLP